MNILMVKYKICKFFRLTAFLDYTRMLAYLAMFGYTHQENETPLATAITGKQAVLLLLFIFTL